MRDPLIYTIVKVRSGGRHHARALRAALDQAERDLDAQAETFEHHDHPWAQDGPLSVGRPGVAELLGAPQLVTRNKHTYVYAAARIVFE